LADFNRFLFKRQEDWLLITKVQSLDLLGKQNKKKGKNKFIKANVNGLKN
jgi:hypothetical protein